MLCNPARDQSIYKPWKEPKRYHNDNNHSQHIHRKKEAALNQPCVQPMRPDKMAVITSDCDAMRYPAIKWP